MWMLAQPMAVLVSPMALPVLSGTEPKGFGLNNRTQLLGNRAMKSNTAATVGKRSDAVSARAEGSGAASGSMEDVSTSTAAASAASTAATASTLALYKHILLPVMDRNPFLNEATRQALAFGTALAKSNSSQLTVVVIDEDEKEDSTDHKQRLDSIRFHLGEGGYSEFGLLERLGEGKMPAAVVGEVADDLEMDLVVLPMEAVHHKHIDCNLLAEFVPCPVLLLPL